MKNTTILFPTFPHNSFIACLVGPWEVCSFKSESCESMCFHPYHLFSALPFHYSPPPFSTGGFKEILEP